MITNIFIASKDEAKEILNFHSQDKSWESLEFNGLDNSAISGLISAIGDEDLARGFEGEDFLIEFDPEGPWVFEFPAAFVSKIAQASDEEISEISDAWAASEQLSFMGVSGLDISPVAKSISDFAAKATQQNKQLLLWMSL